MTDIRIIVEHNLSKEEALDRRVPFTNSLGLNLGWKNVTVTWHKHEPQRAEFEYGDSVEIRGQIVIRPQAVVIRAESPHTSSMRSLVHAQTLLRKITEQAFAQKLLPLARLES